MSEWQCVAESADITVVKQLAETASTTIQRQPAIIFLIGEMGAGKTTFAQFFIQKLTGVMRVKSPTYTLVEEYRKPTNGMCCAHIDLFRIQRAEEIDDLDILSYSIVLIEWPQQWQNHLPQPTMCYRFEICRDMRFRKIDVLQTQN